MKVLSAVLFLFLFLAGTVYAQSQKREVHVDFRYNIVAGKKTDKFKLVCVLPQTIAGKQEIIETTYSVPPSRIFKENGNLYAEFVLERPFRQKEILISSTLHLYKYDLQTAAQEEGREPYCFVPDSLSNYLQEEQFIEKDHKAIAAMAAALQGADTNATLKNIYAFVNKELSYGGYNYTDSGAMKALETMSGDCSEFADLFVALCRASQIPARVVDGYITDWTNTPKHSWVEVYTPAYGWVPFDPTPGNRSRFNSMSNRYIYLSTVRNDQILNNYHFYTYLSWGEPIQVSGSFDIKYKRQNTDMVLSSVL